jgi:hypothetical protein
VGKGVGRRVEVARVAERAVVRWVEVAEGQTLEGMVVARVAVAVQVAVGWGAQTGVGVLGRAVVV